MTAGHHLVHGERVAMPVRVRDAALAAAMFAVPAAPVQALIAYSGLEAARPWRGKAVCSLVCVRYADGDLGPYHEFGVAFLVRHPDGRRGTGVFVHWLPVNQEFTLEAGRSIWGFPKELADIPLHLAGRTKRCAVRFGGRTAIELAVRSGLPVPVPSGRAVPDLDAYSCLEGTTRRISWTVEASGVRVRPGGARVRLGDHPVAEELREIGLGHARALSTTTVARASMVFGEAEEVRP
ncbi:hypothetical protein Acsp03_13870 [Actinomadura sp. NBRC 104412]|uniref:acetoacetate decarboxylase family protein n=1 Tax=Actinomadura sp. NBRC 104412 TaxID=3032203 RepID=UPI0024A18A7D|nr:acetoacetate decarboxylase family protein [Actinomadura sp. NBRC 104412]GLZ03921.1 hypothetical protein Acsp03_13870 [Actinomadura sp. NBRC 104412]